MYPLPNWIIRVFCFLFDSIRVWTQGPELARWGLYHSSHNPSPSFVEFFALVGLRPQSSNLCLLNSGGSRGGAPHPACRLRWVFTNVLPSLASNYYPPDVCLCNSWDFRCETMLLALIKILRKDFGFYIAIHMLHKKSLKWIFL
jgi:hypothetical protein